MVDEARLEIDEFIEEDETLSSEQLSQDLKEALEDMLLWTGGERALQTSYKANGEWHTLAETRLQTEQRNGEEGGQPIEGGASLEYDVEADSMLIRIINATVSRRAEAIPGVIFSYDDDGHVVSVEVLTASKRVRRSDIQEAA